MTSLIKRLHMYTGLLNFSILLVFGVTGLLATMQPAPEKRVRPEPQVRLVDFTAPPGLDDKEVAARVWESLTPLARPAPPGAVRRDRDNNLTMTFYTPNGPQAVTVLEKENRLRIESRRNDLWHYLGVLHETTSSNRADDWRTRLWGYYNEFSIWSLIGMAASGVYLWLASRPGFRWAQYSFAAGVGIFVLLWALSR
jgi:uncharacterized iron-regulated membrane protein